MRLRQAQSELYLDASRRFAGAAIIVAPYDSLFKGVDNRYYASLAAMVAAGQASFTRAGVKSSATRAGVWTAFASGAPAATDAGVSIEEARTNLLLRSEDFAATWSPIGVSASSNVTTAPDGAATADLITNTSNTAVALIAQSVTVAASSTNDYYVSVYVKKSNKSIITLNAYYNGNSEDNGKFNLDTQTVTGIPYSGEYIFDALPNGWFRIGYRITRDASASRTSILLRIWTNDRAIGATGDALYVWGAQLEAAASGSSYVVTTSASATRPADALAMTGLSQILGNPCTLYLEAALPPIAGTTRRLAVVSDGDASDLLSLHRGAGANVVAQVVTASVAQTSHAKGPYGTVATDLVKMISALGASSDSSAITGTGFGPTAVTRPTGLTRLDIGQDPGGGGNYANAMIRRVIVYPWALTAAQMAGLTA